jgi:hypothetical protein
VSPYAAAFTWWAAHPWIVVWMCVLLSPFVVVLLRLLDDAGYRSMVAPLQWLAIGVVLVAVVLAVAITSSRSAIRAVSGLVLAVAGLLLLVLPTTNLVLGRTACPTRTGHALGLSTAVAVVEAWRAGAVADAAWTGGQASPAWREQVRTLALEDFRLVESGCWDRVAPVRESPTWHEFRVTVRQGTSAPLSKILLVHVADEGGAWKVTGVDGPLP